MGGSAGGALPLHSQRYTVCDDSGLNGNYRYGSLQGVKHNAVETS